MNFATPLVFLLLPVPWLAWRFLAPLNEESSSFYLPSSVAAQMKETPIRASHHLRLALAAVTWILLITAIAGPRILHQLDVLPASARDIVLVIDLSGSMKTEDFDLEGSRATRLAVVKSVGSDFVLSREGDRIGLVVFGDRAYYASPLSFDTQSVAGAIKAAQIGVSGNSTAISDGLGIAIKRLENSEAKSKVIILLSDGVDTTGTIDPTGAAKLAHEMGIKIYTIALGPIDMQSQPGARDAVDAQTLGEIASSGGGKMFRVRSTDDLRQVANTINALEPSPRDAPRETYWQNLWTWPTMAALVVLAILFATEWRARA